MASVAHILKVVNGIDTFCKAQAALIGADALADMKASMCANVVRQIELMPALDLDQSSQVANAVAESDFGQQCVTCGQH